MTSGPSKSRSPSLSTALRGPCDSGILPVSLAALHSVPPMASDRSSLPLLRDIRMPDIHALRIGIADPHERLDGPYP